jgi:glycosyltransferase involved in cell wall biosynthesis
LSVAKSSREGNALEVSVLLPVRNAAGTLSLCLGSIARQKGCRLECVVVDDGSSDESAAIAEKFAAADRRFRVLRREPLGIVAALNEGMDHCHAPFVARMDADDWMHSLRLRLQGDALRVHPDWSGVGCHVRLFPRKVLRGGLRDYEAWLHSIREADQVRAERFIECPLPHPTWMLRRPVLARFRYRDSDWPEDYELLLRMLGQGELLGVVPRRLLGWREGESRLWRRDPRYGRRRFGACRAHYIAQGPLRGRETYHLWGFGETGKALRHDLAAHGKRPAAIIELHPRRLGECIHGAPVVPPEALPTLPRLPLLVSVAGAAPRAEIRAQLASWGFCEGADYFCAA